MNSVKKLLPYLLVAIVFAVGGYFIGKGATANDNGAASIFGITAKVAPKTGPTNPGSPLGGGSGTLSSIPGIPTPPPNMIILAWWLDSCWSWNSVSGKWATNTVSKANCNNDAIQIHPSGSGILSKNTSGTGALLPSKKTLSWINGACHIMSGSSATGWTDIGTSNTLQANCHEAMPVNVLNAKTQ